MWMAELEQIEGISSEEEEKRELVASEINDVLQYGLKADVYGSAKSLYGSLDSDLDMCVFISAPSTSNKLPTEVLGFYYLKKLMERKVWDDDRVRMTTVEKIEQLKKAHSQVVDAVKNLYHAKDPNQRQLASFFDFEMQLLIDALTAELGQLYWEERATGEAIPTSRTAQKEKLLRVSKRRKNALFEIKSMLECSPFCTIDAVASHARVPVLRFRYIRDSLEYKCDLCVGNELGMRNTRLLRAYAGFDDRARELGLAVKHWAKQRDITDTASGFLSSYSFVLLSIYYLQIVHVLPNLQNPQLLELADISPEYYDGVSIAFCEDRDIAQIYHEHTDTDSDSLDASLPALLLGFFEFYATEFDCIKHVVTIRSPETSVPTFSQWGCKSKTWRMSIQDPLETMRDVGGVLHFNAQLKLTHELRRAYEMLVQSESFLDVVCLKQQ